MTRGDLLGDETASHAAHRAVEKQELSQRLMKLLTDAKDPRLIGDGKTFDRSPFTDLPEEPEGKKAKKNKAK